MADYIDVREFKKNNQKKNSLCVTFAEMAYEANKQYLLCDLPDNIIIEKILYIDNANLINGGTAAAPATAKVKYIKEDATLQDLEEKFYKKPNSLVLDVGATAFSGAICVTYIEMSITTGFYS